MPVDMPPVDNEPLQLQQSATQAEIRLEAKGFLYIVRGNTLLPTDTIKHILEQAENPLQAARLLREAYAKKGYVLVKVTADQRGLIIVQEFQIAHIEGPAYAKVYMASLRGRKDVSEVEFNRKFANALNEAARRGERLEYQLNPDPLGSNTVDLVLEAKKARRSKANKPVSLFPTMATVTLVAITALPISSFTLDMALKSMWESTNLLKTLGIPQIQCQLYGG